MPIVFNPFTGNLEFKSSSGGGGGTAFVQGGNSFGTTAILGTNDAQNLFIRNNGLNTLILDQFNNAIFTKSVGIQSQLSFAGNAAIDGFTGSLRIGLGFLNTDIYASNSVNKIARFLSVASSADFLVFKNTTSGGNPLITVDGSDADIGLSFNTKGVVQTAAYTFFATQNSSPLFTAILFLSNSLTAPGDSSILHYNNTGANLGNRSVIKLQQNTGGTGPCVTYLWGKGIDIINPTETQFGLDITSAGLRTPVLTFDGTGMQISKFSKFGTFSIPVATVDITAGTVTNAPLKFTSGSLTTGINIRPGQHEFLTDDFYLTGTTLSTRKVIRDLVRFNTSSNLTLDGSHEFVVFTAGTNTATLPTAVNFNKPLTICNIGTGTITINTTGGETINGLPSGSFSLIQFDTIILRSDGTNWIKIN